MTEEKRQHPHVVNDALTGKPTVTPGYYPDLPNDSYHEGPGWSSSNIKVLHNKSPLHLWDQKINPEKDPPGERAHGATLDALGFGTAYHTITLEPDLFDDEFIVVPELPEGCTTRNKAGKDFLAGFFAEHEDTKTIINQDDMETLSKMAAALRAHPRLSKILDPEKGVAESSFFHVDEETGLLVKIRPDYLRKNMYIADLKTSAEATYDGFSRAIDRFGYHISAAMYLDVFKGVTGEDYQGNFVFAVQEKVRPYAVASFVLCDDAIALGRDIYRKSMRTLAEQIDKHGNDPWDGYPVDIQSIDMPPWAYKKV